MLGSHNAKNRRSSSTMAVWKYLLHQVYRTRGFSKLKNWLIPREDLQGKTCMGPSLSKKLPCWMLMYCISPTKRGSYMFWLVILPSWTDFSLFFSFRNYTVYRTVLHWYWLQPKVGDIIILVFIYYSSGKQIYTKKYKKSLSVQKL